MTYVYGRGTPFEKKALDDVCLTFAPGKITGLMGHTGSGKSTIAQLLNGLLRADAGTVLLNGEDIWKDSQTNAANPFSGGTRVSISGISTL